jgi:3-oxoacyl-[acyl-carrier protein] reductase
MDLKLAGKVALVTGSSKGIGFTTARTLIEEGCRVVLSARNKDDLAAAKEKLPKDKTLTIQADVTNPKDAERLVNEAASWSGGIDILVNNVGGNSGGIRVVESTDEDWQKTLEVNLFQTVRMMRHAIPRMSKRAGAAIVNISSISGWTPQLVGSGQYGAAKAALIFDTERWALECIPHGIRVNTVSPGSIWGEGNGWDRYKKSDPEGYEDYVRGGFPMGRLGYLEEVADVICFLLSPRANWINGRNVPVDGLEQPYPRRDRRPY